MMLKEPSVRAMIEASIEELLREGKSPPEVLRELEARGYSIVHNGVYPNGIKCGQTTVYHPRLS